MGRWLNPEIHEADRIAVMMQPCKPELLECVEVSTLVNSVKNNRAEVLEPINLEKTLGAF